MGSLVTSPARVLTCWERGLLDLADHYGATGGMEYYGSWVRAFIEEAAKGCKNRRQFRTIVGDITDTDKNSGDMPQRPDCARLGKLSAVLSGTITYEKLFGFPPAVGGAS